MKEIHVRLTQRGVTQAIRELKAYRAQLIDRASELASRLAAVGINVARVRFAAAAYDGDPGQITVTVERDGTSATIYASGQKIAFIEFGTGVTNPEYPNSPFERGKYGQGKGANPKGWIYKGQPGTNGQPVFRNGKERPGVYRTKGNPPAMAMWGAAEEMAAQVLPIAQEVFGRD